VIGSRKGVGVLNGFLDRGARFEGTLSFEDTFRIDGVLKGKVVTKNELVIGDGAAIDAEIHAGRLSVSGSVKGVIYARERVEVHAGARIQAEIHTPSLLVEDGAVIHGPVETGPQVGRAPGPPSDPAIPAAPADGRSKQG
jgi:cytoskeletal protein CcmA (bactofilin family)